MGPGRRAAAALALALAATAGSVPGPSSVVVEAADPCAVQLGPFASGPAWARLVPVPMRRAASIGRALAALDGDRELVGQLLMLGWPGSSSSSVRRLLRALRPGGVVFLAANADTAAAARRLTTLIAGTAADLGMPPPLRALDLEGGRVQRIRDIRDLGSNRAFARSGADERAAFRRGARHAAQLRAMGFDLDLAPVLDVVTEPRNRVIGDRAYGSEPDRAATLGSAYIEGLQAGGVLATAKHFPGHGDTVTDSHLALPVVRHDRARLDRVELVPFARAVAPGTDVAAVMTAHIALPALDPSGSPATLSSAIVTGLLRGELGFDGLVISDDMGAMLAITGRYGPGEAAVLALEAGVDMLILVGDRERQRAARDGIVEALATGRLPRERVLAAVASVLRAKARLDLLPPAPPLGPPAELGPPC